MFSTILFFRKRKTFIDFNGFYGNDNVKELIKILFIFFRFRRFVWFQGGSRNILFSDIPQLVQYSYLLRGTNFAVFVFPYLKINTSTTSSCSQSSSIVSSLPSNILLKKQSKYQRNRIYVMYVIDLLNRYSIYRYIYMYVNL